MIMAETKKYQRKTKGFESQRESLAFAPKDAGADRLARDRARNTETLLNNYQRQGDADLISMDLAFKQQEVIDDHNDRVAKLSQQWHAEDLQWFSPLLQYGIGHMARKTQKADTEKAQKDFLKLARNPEIRKQILTPFLNNVKLHDENIRDLTAVGFEKHLEGEELALVKRILNGAGYYSQNMRRLMKADVIEQLPAQVQQKLSEKVIIPDEVFPGIPEAISIEDISREGEHKDLQGNIQPHGKYYKLLHDPTSGRDIDGSVLQYLYAEAQGKVETVLGKWYGMESVIADFQPVMTAYFGDRNIEDAAKGRKFWNSNILQESRAVTVKEVKNLIPSESVRELVKDVNAIQAYMGGHTAAYQTKLNQILVAFENGEITLSTARALEGALVDSKDHDNIGFTGEKKFKDWRQKDFDAVNWDKRIDAHIKAKGKEAAAKQSNAITSLQGQMVQYTSAKGEKPSIELITKWATTLEQNGESGGLSVAHMVEKATENMSTQEGDTIDNMKKKLEKLLESGPIQPEVVANYPPEIRDWLKENDNIADSTWGITSTMKSDIATSLKALNTDILKANGDYDQVLSREMLRVNGNEWLSKEYKRQRAAGTPSHAAWQGPDGALARWEKMVREKPEAWTVRRASGEFVKQNTQSAFREYNLRGQNFNKVLPALETRVEAVAAHVRNGGRFNPDMTYLADDGNYYKVYDDTMNQLAASSGYTKGEILKQQLEDVGLTVGLDGEFKYLNADRRTQYIMERGGSGKIRAEVNASIKDNHLEKLEINQDGGKPYLGLPIASLMRPAAVDRNFEEITGINAEYLKLVEPNGFKGVLDKLGIKSHERLSPKHIALIQKRVLSEHGGIPFGTIDTEETGQSSTVYNGSPENILPGINISFGNDPNQRIPELEGKRISYASPKDKFTPIGTTRKVGFRNLTQVFGVLGGSDTSVHLGWRAPESQKHKPWVLELMKTQNPYMKMDVQVMKPSEIEGVEFRTDGVRF